MLKNVKSQKKLREQKPHFEDKNLTICTLKDTTADNLYSRIQFIPKVVNRSRIRSDLSLVRKPKLFFQHGSIKT